jgi:hypothetical protein
VQLHPSLCACGCRCPDRASLRWGINEYCGIVLLGGLSAGALCNCSFSPHFPPLQGLLLVALPALRTNTHSKFCVCMPQATYPAPAGALRQVYIVPALQACTCLQLCIEMHMHVHRSLEAGGFSRPRGRMPSFDATNPDPHETGPSPCL